MEGDFHSWQINDLKGFLKNRGITCHIYRKHQLIRLCELAQELQLESIQADADKDYVDSYVARRTVRDHDKTVVLCELRDIPEWQINLHGLPNVEHCDVLIYILKTCGCTENRLKSYKEDSGYRLFTAGHVDDVSVASIPESDSFKYIKATCLPETRQNADPYMVWLLIATTGAIVSGGCSCVVDDGTCKDCIALLFAVTNFCDRHQDRHTLVGTDVECKWDRPRVSSEPMEVNEIDIRSDQTTELPLKASVDNYEPILKLNAFTRREVEKKVYKLRKSTNAVLLQCLDPPSDESDIEVESYPPTLLDLAESVKDSENPAVMLK